MSHHSSRLHGLTIRTLHELEARSRLHPPPIYAPAFYIGGLTAGNGPKLLLEAVVESVLRGRVFTPGQARLAQIYRRDRRSISRWVKQLVERRWVRVVRRGKKLTNLYRLTRHFWGRLTGRYKSKLAEIPWLHQLDLRMRARLADDQQALEGLGRRR